MIKYATKFLSGNDIGITNSHQAGFLLPKSLINDGLFEALSNGILNPRLRLKFIDIKSNREYYFNFIYYNNKFFGGTRHEYRLTRMTRWIKDNGLRCGDAIEIARISGHEYSIVVQKALRQPISLSEESWIVLYGKVEDNG